MQAMAKRVATALLSVIVMLSLMLGSVSFSKASAYADPATQQGTVKILGESYLVGKDISAYKMFSAARSADGSSSVTYTLESAWEGFFQSLQDSTTNKYLGTDGTFSSDVALTGADLSTAAYNYVNSLKGDPLAGTDYSLAAFAGKAKAWALDGSHSISATITKQFAADAVASTGYSATFENLDYGYYLFIPPGGSVSATRHTDAMLLNVISETQADVALKSEYPTVEKLVSATYNDTGSKYEDYAKADDQQIGKKVGYQLTTVVPDMTDYNVTNGYTFKWVDEMPEGLTPVMDAVTPANFAFKVTLVDTGASPATETDATTNFTATVADNVATGGKTITVEPTSAVDFYTNFNDDAGKTLVLTYEALVNENAEIGSTGNTNSATITYSTDPTDPTQTEESVESSATVHTFKAMIDKIIGPTTDVEAATRLDGATFKLRTSNDATATDNVVSLYKVSEGVYRVATDAEVTTGTNIVTEFTTPKADSTNNVELGRVRILGLDAADYYLEETAAPSGYNKMEGLLKITPVANYVTGGGVLDTWKVSYGNTDPQTDALQDATDTTQTRIVIENKTGSILPTTGGIGTIIFAVLGVILVAVGITWYVRNKKGKNDFARK